MQKPSAMLEPRVDPEIRGVNIDGACLFDPFSRGKCSGNPAAVFHGRCPGRDGIQSRIVWKRQVTRRHTPLAPMRIFLQVSEEYLGGTLGFEEIRDTFTNIGDTIEGADIAPVLSELQQQEERVVRACDKYLRRYDPPAAAIFAGCSYALFAAKMLGRYLDADICCVGSRNRVEEAPFPVVHADGLPQVKDLIRVHGPDLVIGSSFERAVSGDVAFCGIVPPLRGTVRLYPSPLAGINGTLSFIENVLNACMDKKI